MMADNNWLLPACYHPQPIDTLCCSVRLQISGSWLPSGHPPSEMSLEAMEHSPTTILMLQACHKKANVLDLQV